MKYLKVGALRKALEGVDDGVEVVVRAEDGEGNSFCGGLYSAGVELGCGGDDTPYFALDGSEEPDEDEPELTENEIAEITTAQANGGGEKP